VTASPVRGREVSSVSWAAFLLLLLSAAAWLAPLAFADPPATPKDADPATVAGADAQTLVFKHPGAFLALATLKYIPAVVGLVLLIMEWIRLRDVRRGLLPPFPPLRPATAPAGIAIAAGAVFAFFAIPTLMLVGVAMVDPTFAAKTFVHVLAFGVGSVPIAIATVVARRRMVEAGAPGPAPAKAALKDALRTFCVATLAVSGSSAVVYLVMQRFGIEPQSQELVNKVAFSPDPLDPLSIALYGVLIAPWVEECVFRGLLQPAVRSRFGVPAGVWVSALVFTLFHYESARGVGNLFSLVPLLVLSLFLARLRDRTDSLLATTTVHVLNNATTIVPLLFLRG
jgi:membrane protease YdiL (CAAX protease family)